LISARDRQHYLLLSSKKIIWGVSRIRRIFALAVILLIVTCCLAGCLAQEDKIIRIGVVDWPEDRVMSAVVESILENKFHYDVELAVMHVDEVFAALAAGECDLFLDCWLPITHEKYINQYGSQLENIGRSYDGARTGLVVPEYVTITNITQLNEYKQRFKSQIIGIESDSGINKSTYKAIEAYQLDYTLTAESSSAMIDRLAAAIAQEEWIVVTGWLPHWKFTTWDLKFLDDPSFIYGGEENLHIITRKGFSDDYPEISEFLFRFKLDKPQMNSLLLTDKITETSIKDTSLSEWLAGHQQLIDSWL